MKNDLNALRAQLKDEIPNLAFILGNGVNRYAYDSKGASWQDMLLYIYHQITGKRLSSISEGVSYTEFYNILSLEGGNMDILRKTVVDYTYENYRSEKYHHWLQEELVKWDVPVLTTNFDKNLDSEYQKHKIFKYEGMRRGFTDFYPWNVYYGPNALLTPLDGFAVWHINGVIDYPRSIRLGLSEYINQTARARDFLHKDEKIMDFDLKNRPHWNGSNTWLHIIFNTSLCFIGLGLDVNETFLRWLLLERARYFKKYPERAKKGWYVTADNVKDGQQFFLDSTGIEVVKLQNYDEVYRGVFE